MLADWAQAAAESLALRLRSGRLPKAGRKQARRLLAQAFQALEAGAVTADLFRALDDAGPPGPRIPAPPRIGQVVRLAVLDWDLVGRVFAYETSHALIVDRAQRFLEVTGGGSLSLTVKAPRVGAGAELDMEFTEG